MPCFLPIKEQTQRLVLVQSDSLSHAKTDSDPYMDRLVFRRCDTLSPNRLRSTWYLCFMDLRISVSKDSQYASISCPKCTAFGAKAQNCKRESL